MIGRRGSSARVSSVGAGTDRRAREEHGSGAEELRDRRSKILWSAMVLGNATRTRDGRVRTGQTNVGAFRGRRRSLPAGARSGGRAPAGSVRSGSRSAPAATPVSFGGTDRRISHIGPTGGRADKHRSGPVFGGRRARPICRSHSVSLFRFPFCLCGSCGLVAGAGSWSCALAHSLADRADPSPERIRAGEP